MRGNLIIELSICVFLPLLVALPLQAQWLDGGTPVCTAAGDQASHKIASDGAGGAIITWVNTSPNATWVQLNTGLTNLDVRALIANMSNDVFAGTHGGGIFRSTDRCESWTHVLTGIYVSSLAVSPDEFIFAGSPGGGVYRSTNNGDSWIQQTNGLTNTDVRSIAVNSSGHVFAGTASGVFRSTDHGHNWSHVLSGDITYSLTVNRDDNVFAGTGGSGVFRSTDNGDTWDQINTGLACLDVRALTTYWSDVYAGTYGGGFHLSVDNGDTWMQSSGGLTDMDIQSLLRYSHSILYAGTPSGVFSTYNNGISWQPDNNGLVNTDIRALARIKYSGYVFSGSAGGGVSQRLYDYNIYAHRIDANGSILWAENGEAICTSLGPHHSPEIIPDGAGGAIIAWIYNDRNWVSDVYAQRIDGNGIIQWPADGIPVCTANGYQQTPGITPDGSGGAVITWQEEPFGNHIHIQRVDGGGNALWQAGGVVLASVMGVQNQLASTGDGGAIVAWTDSSSGTPYIHAQKVDATGTVKWQENGIQICPMTPQRWPQLITDGCGGAIITWQDGRSWYNDIIAQRVDSLGTILWDTYGVAICSAAGFQYAPMIVSDGSGGAVVAWRDTRDGNDDIFAQRVSGSGVIQWTADGIPVCDESSAQNGIQIIPDGAGGTIITWKDERNGGYDIYAQKIDAYGEASWDSNGVAICVDPSSQYGPQTVPNGSGGTIISWQDKRNGNEDIYATKIDADGDVVATLLHSYSCRLFGSAVLIDWTLSEAGEKMLFFISRADAQCGSYEELITPGISRDGLTFSFRDESARPGGSYTYRVDVSDERGPRVLFETGPILIPEKPLTLCQNHPNPFNPSTTIRYFLPEAGRTVLEVFDISGRKIARLIDEEKPGGGHGITWTGKDNHGNPVSSGVYIYRLTAGKMRLTRKMVLLR